MRIEYHIMLFLVLFPADCILGQQKCQWTLQMCIEYALERNIQVRKGELATKRSVTALSQAKAQRYPTLNGSFSQNLYWDKSVQEGQNGFNGGNGSSYSVYSGIELFNGFKISSQVQQSELGIESSRYALETVKESISLSVLDSYLQVLYAEEKVNNSLKQIEATEEQLRLAKERLELKIISQADFAQVRSQLSGEKLTLANARNQLSVDMIILKQLMELPADSDMTLNRPEFDNLLKTQSKPDAIRIFETSLAIRPQIKNADLNKQIAVLDKKIAAAGYFPSISASAGITSAYSSANDGTYFNQLNKGIHPSAGLTLSIPLYQRRQVKSNIENAQINYYDAELSEADTRNQLRKAIEQACQELASAQSEYIASIENYEATREATRLAEEKFTQGLINSVEYLVSKTNLTVAESQLLQAKYALIFSSKVLDFYEGVPLTL